MNEVNEMLPFIAFFELVFRWCGLFVSPLTSLFPSLLWAQHRGFLLWTSSVKAVLEVSPPPQLGLTKHCWKGSAIPTEGESWVLARGIRGRASTTGRVLLPPPRAVQAQTSFSSHTSTALHRRASITLSV